MTDKEINEIKADACNDIIENKNFIVISTSGDKFSVTHHISAENLAKFIGWLEVVKLDMVETIIEAGQDVLSCGSVGMDRDGFPRFGESFACGRRVYD